MELRISMARLHHLLSRALASQCPIRPSPLPSSARPTLPLHSQPPPPRPHGRSLPPFLAAASRYYASSISRRRRRGSAPPILLRRRKARRKGPSELSVQIGIEEALPDEPLVLSIAEALRNDVGKAVKLALHNLENSEYKTRDPCISSVDKYDSVDVSLLLCDDGFIRKLNKEWWDEDHATDVLSMSHHIPGLDIPILQLGDVVISVETARRQAEERGHTLLDEIRILMTPRPLTNQGSTTPLQIPFRLQSNQMTEPRSQLPPSRTTTTALTEPTTTWRPTTRSSLGGSQAGGLASFDQNRCLFPPS